MTPPIALVRYDGPVMECSHKVVEQSGGPGLVDDTLEFKAQPKFGFVPWCDINKQKCTVVSMRS